MKQKQTKTMPGKKMAPVEYAATGKAGGLMNQPPAPDMSVAHKAMVEAHAHHKRQVKAGKR